MVADQALALREAIVTKLLATAAVTAILDQRVYGEEPPTANALIWPFCKYGDPSATRFEAACWQGGDHDVTLHAFAKGPGADPVLKLAAEIETALSDDALPFDGLLISIDHERTDVVRDIDEIGSYHAIMRFSVVTSA